MLDVQFIIKNSNTFIVNNRNTTSALILILKKNCLKEDINYQVIICKNSSSKYNIFLQITI